MKYLFKSERLGFRNWLQSDIEPMSAINSDAEVMAFFPGVVGSQQTELWIKKKQIQFEEKSYCYFAVDILATQDFIGFIGLSDPAFKASFTPCVDIGWRLHRSAWNKGYATEGAVRCLKYAFHDLGIKEIYATAPIVNKRSENIMKKIGMKKEGNFIHPLLLDDILLKHSVLYKIEKPL